MKFRSGTELNTKSLLKRVTDFQIYSFYIPGFKVGKNISIPWKVDKKPSLGFYQTTQGINWRDFTTSESGGSIYFVAKKFNLDYQEAIYKINLDLRLGLYSPEIRHIKRSIGSFQTDPIVTVKPKSRIEVITQPWTFEDTLFWNKYGISIPMLEYYRIYSINTVLIDGEGRLYYSKKNPIYGFAEFKDGKTSWKIYRPYSSNLKWLNNADYSTIQGWNQMKPADTLIITKSLKDVLVLRTLNYQSIAFQSESIITIKDSVLEILRANFKDIYLLYDNDEAGIKASNTLSEKYLFKQIFMDETKDVSDYRKMFGYNLTKDKLEYLLLDNKEKEEYYYKQLIEIYESNKEACYH